jgi:hypothetical protein
MNIEEELITRMKSLSMMLEMMTAQNLTITQELSRITQALQKGQDASHNPDLLLQQMNELLAPISGEIAAIRQSLE